MRVTARTAASASATSPTTCAPTVEAPEGAAEVLATGSVRPVAEVCGAADDCGLTVGNSPAALPPGLRVDDDVDGTVGSAPTGSVATGVVDIPAGVVDAEAGVEGARTGVVDAAARVGGARMVTAPDAAGSAIRLAALPVAVRLTEVTVVAVAGTVSCAWSSRIAEVASTAPRSHKAVPSPCAQPKLKVGVPAPEGEAPSCSLTSATLPPVVQASTAQWVACPRWRLGCRGATPTHTLTCAVVTAVKTMESPPSPRAAVVLAVVDAVPLELAGGVVVAVAGVGVVDAVVGVGDVVVWVGVGVEGT